MKRILIVLLAAFTLTVVTVTAALAAPTIVIPIDTVVRAPAGSVTRLAEADVPPNLVGFNCTGFATAENQDSVHPNNDLILTSGGTTAVLPDVEGTPYEISVATGTLLLGETITVDLLMGPDGVFSGGMEIVIDTNCTAPQVPAIEIVKTADTEYYSDNGVGDFTITVTNPGPVDLFDVYVTDDDALAMDPASNCPTVIGDLAVDESYTYGCSVANLDGISPFDNEATAIGVDNQGTQVTATDAAVIFPPVQNTTITAAPTTTLAPATTLTPDSTLPVTGIDSEQLRGFSFAGLALLLLGIMALGGAAVLGQYRREH